MPCDCCIKMLRACLAAAQLGAEVADAPDAATTHVVAARDRTDKVLWARQRARFAVSPLWLHSCGACARARQALCRMKTFGPG